MQPIRPFLKWAGGKTKLVSELRRLAPCASHRFVEPFVGSGVVALNLGFAVNLLADANADLIEVYRILKREGDAFIDSCASLFSAKTNDSAAYYALRDEFNTTRDAQRKAALFIYLNRHGYNGLCRYNAQGRFNVPFGRYHGPRLPREPMRAFHRFLQHCRIRRADFREVLQDVGPGDFVYCDPPYMPASATSDFTNYAQGGFHERDQFDLVVAARAAAARGAWVALSNHDTPLMREFYHDADERHELSARRRISCHGAERADARELLVIYRARQPAVKVLDVLRAPPSIAAESAPALAGTGAAPH